MICPDLRHPSPPPAPSPPLTQPWLGVKINEVLRWRGGGGCSISRLPSRRRFKQASDANQPGVRGTTPHPPEPPTIMRGLKVFAVQEQSVEPHCDLTPPPQPLQPPQPHQRRLRPALPTNNSILQSICCDRRNPIVFMLGFAGRGRSRSQARPLTRP